MKLIKKVIDENDNQIKFSTDNYTYWPDNLNKLTFLDFFENKVQLKHNENFKIFDQDKKVWNYFKFIELDKGQYFIPIVYWFTKTDILTYIAMFISLLSFIISIL